MFDAEGRWQVGVVWHAEPFRHRLSVEGEEQQLVPMGVLNGALLLLLVAFAIYGLKEFGEPTRKALIIAQASVEIRPRTYKYYLTSGYGRNLQ